MAGRDPVAGGLTLRILAYEHFTALGRHSPPDLRAEGGAMLAALALDLTSAGHDVVASLGPGAAPPWGAMLAAAGVRFVTGGSGAPRATSEAGAASEAAAFEALLRSVDAVWIVAPETAGRLEELTRLASATGKRVIGSSPEGIRLAASKLLTFRRLGDAGVPCVPTLAMPRPEPPTGARAWGLPLVVKPDDGVGSESVRLVRRIADVAEAWCEAGAGSELVQGSGRVVVQPYVPGTAASVSLLVGPPGVLPLALQRQVVLEEAGRLRYAGGEVPLDVEPADEVEALSLACAACSAIPGLGGFVGVDLVLGAGGVTVIEVNPRLTTSYLGLRLALDVNLASVALDCLDGRDVVTPPVARRVRYATGGGAERRGPARSFPSEREVRMRSPTTAPRDFDVPDPEVPTDRP